MIKFVSDFFPGTPISFTNKTGHHDIAEILLKVTLSTINPSPNLLLPVDYDIYPLEIYFQILNLKL
jgi:hypothetical protein